MKEFGYDELKVVIIDSNSDFINTLSTLLHQYNGIKVIASAESARKGGLEKISLHKPDIIFWDMESYDIDGFRLISSTGFTGYNPTIIVTFEEKNALKAVNQDAFDYLLKPVNKLELDLTINRIKSMNKIKNQGLLESLLGQMITPRVMFKTKTDCILIEPKEVMYCEANGNYSAIIMNPNKKEFVSYNLGKIFDIFSKYNFIRIERSFIINKDYLDRINKSNRICTLVKNSDTVKLKISRAYMQNFSNMFSC